EPTALLGHSAGEYAAACVAGVFSLEQGLTLVTRRAKLMASLPKTGSSQAGSMAVILAGESDVRPMLAGREEDVSLAAVDGPNCVVIPGRSGAGAERVQICEARGIGASRLAVSHAFHSPLLTPILDEFAELVRAVPHQPPQVPLSLNLTGAVCAAPDCIGPE